MGFLDSLKSKSQQMSQQLNTKKGQLKSKEFAQGSMAMCALIAAADGSIDPVEQRKTNAVISTNDVLSIFDQRDLQEIFDKYAYKLGPTTRSARWRRSRRSASCVASLIRRGHDPDRDHHRRRRRELRRVRADCRAGGMQRPRHRPERVRPLVTAFRGTRRGRTLRRDQRFHEVVDAVAERPAPQGAVDDALAAARRGRPGCRSRAGPARRRVEHRRR